MKKNNRGIIVKSLIKNIRQELSALEEIYSQIELLLKKAETISKEERNFYNRVAGSILHDFYTGIEKIFCDVANKIDKGLPKARDWHIRLLKDMAEIKEKRPQVISLELLEELKEYLGFRHLFRNIYGAQLDWGKLKILLVKIQGNLWERLKKELDLFIKRINEGNQKKGIGKLKKEKI
jgi:hypothetical protein